MSGIVGMVYYRYARNAMPGPLVANDAIRLRARYALSRTETGYGAIGLSSTGIVYGGCWKQGSEIGYGGNTW
eukprot:1389697-Rhodomonas_salina.1